MSKNWPPCRRMKQYKGCLLSATDTFNLHLGVLMTRSRFFRIDGTWPAGKVFCGGGRPVK